jgi:hypothetical protein
MILNERTAEVTAWRNATLNTIKVAIDDYIPSLDAYGDRYESDWMTDEDESFNEWVDRLNNNLCSLRYPLRPEGTCANDKGQTIEIFVNF